MDNSPRTGDYFIDTLYSKIFLEGTSNGIIHIVRENTRSDDSIYIGNECICQCNNLQFQPLFIPL